ncbi:hypothetical protein [Nitrosomonas supralitoralis]|uniref:Uncharacterized protein n=1 Tax=Nitrosomonas supralitoralis TaxID=2116706 RepID=A0A2P7NQX3_9PROT|nr:hypothetical protein [Nitrosomonas supralitoralis]PSJ15848.1 hypothetical protein C7H79_16770 [Nitrosomonas supralitoralis]
MKKVFVTLLLATLIFPSAAVLADYGDDLKKRDKKELQGNHKNIPLQPSGTSPAPTFDPSGTPENLKTPLGIGAKNKSGNNHQNSGQIK